jgi:hypothetical protein
MRQNLPPTRTGEEDWRIGSGIFQIQYRNQQRTDFATRSELPVTRNEPNSDEFGPVLGGRPFHRWPVFCGMYEDHP